MKLIQKTGSKPESPNSTKTKQFGLFECPVCHEHVEKPLAHGRRNKSCGKVECRKATFTNDKADTSSYRKNPILSTLPYYDSISAYHNRIMNSPYIKVSEEFKDLRKFVELTYVEYATVRELLPRIPVSIVAKDGSEIITGTNYKFIAAQDEQLTKEMFEGDYKFCCRKLMYELGVTYAVAVGTIKNTISTYKEGVIITKYGNRLKTIILDESSYIKVYNRILHNKAREKSSWVYLVSSAGYTKIGITNDVDKRLVSLRTSTPFEVNLIGSWKIGEDMVYAIEQYIHSEYAEFNTKLEWFKLTDEQIKIIKEKLNNSEEIIKFLQAKKEEEETKKIQEVKEKNTKLIKDRLDRYEESKRLMREANKKPVIETVHEWDERFAHDRTNQIKSTTTHGMSHTDLYKTWQNMKKVYAVCDEWQIFEPFQKVVEQEYAQYTEEQAARVYPLIVGVPIGPTNYKIESKYQHEIKSGVAKAVEKLGKTNEVLAEYASVTEAAKAVDGIASKISAVCKGTRKTHAGFNWRYKE